MGIFFSGHPFLSNRKCLIIEWNETDKISYSVHFTQLPFFNLCSFGALPFDQSWSDQPWKSHWKIFNWTMLISILFIFHWLWRLDICVITSILNLVLECASICMDGWIKIFLSRLKGWLYQSRIPKIIICDQPFTELLWICYMPPKQMS